jgi:hypothetical protein
MAGSFQKTSGTFKNVASTPKFIPLVQQVHKFTLWNLTRSGVPALGVAGSLSSNHIYEAMLLPGIMTNGTAWIQQNGTVAGILAPKQNGYLAQNGLTYIDAANRTLGAPIAVASFVPGSPTVWTTGTAHGYIVGDIVRVYGLTTAPELGGLAMTVTAVGSPTTFTTLLDSSNSLTSVGFVRKIGSSALPPSSLYYPEIRAIASITQANPMVVTTLVQQNYAIGDVVRFQIPQQPTVAGVNGYGMNELNSTANGLPFEATISAVNNAIGTQTVTFANVDSTAFAPFAWPGSGFYPISLPVMIPQGEGNTNNLIGVAPFPLPYGNQNVLSFATQNLGNNGILIGVGDGTNAAATGGIITAEVEAWYWECETMDQTFTN